MSLPSSSRTKVEIDPKIVWYFFGSLFSILTIWFLKNILILLILSYIIAVALNPAVIKIQQKSKLSRHHAIIIVYLTVIVVLSISVGLVLPSLLTELKPLLKYFNLPFVQKQLSQVEFTFREINELIKQVGGSFSLLISLVTGTFSSFLNTFTLLMISFYILIDKEELYKKIYWFSNDKHTILKFKDFLVDIDHQLGGWVRGQIVLMSVISVITFLGLITFKIPYALPLAILAGLLEVVPNLGPTIAAIPAIIIAYLTYGPVIGSAILFMYIIIQQLENNLLVPQVMSHNAKVNPLPAIVSLLVGFQFFGVSGTVIAIPVYIAIRAFYTKWIKQA